MDEPRKAVAEAMNRQAQKKKPQTLRGINADPVAPKRPQIMHDQKKNPPSFIRG